MTKDQIDAIPRMSTQEVYDANDPECRYSSQLIMAIESAMNLEWWRGYHAALGPGQSTSQED